MVTENTLPYFEIRRQRIFLFAFCLKPCLYNIHVVVFLLQGLFESIFSVWPISQLFELNGSIHEWWFRWKLDRFVSQMCSALQTLMLLSAFATKCSSDIFWYAAGPNSWCCSFAGCNTRHGICLHLSGASETPGVVRGQRRSSVLCQDFQPAPIPFCRLLHCKTVCT